MWKILPGEARAMLRTLPAEIVHCCVTSPPYFGLRSYGTEPQVWGGDSNCAHEWGLEEPGQRARWGDLSTLSTKQASNGGSKANVAALERSGGQFCQKCGAWLGELGQEPHPDLFVAHLVEVFREVRRVLHHTATLWVNLGDSYATSPPGNKGFHYGPGRKAQGILETGHKKERLKCIPFKSLLMIPARFALAMQADGWILRSEIIWAKKSAMPESIRDRPSSSTERIYLFAKQPKYYYDQDAVRQPYNADSLSRYKYEFGHGPACAVAKSPAVGDGNGFNCVPNPAGANLRNYWDIQEELLTDDWLLGPEPTKEEHFAAFPTEIPRRAIRLGSSEHGVCPDCGNPWRRVTKKGKPDREWQAACGGDRNGEYHGKATKEFDDNGVQNASAVKARVLAGMGKRQTLAWEPTCACDVGPPIPATVLDIFSGTGTTGVVAVRNGRRYIGCELQPKYVAISEKRLRKEENLFMAVALSGQPSPPEPKEKPLTLFSGLDEEEVS